MRSFCISISISLMIALSMNSCSEDNVPKSSGTIIHRLTTDDSILIERIKGIAEISVVYRDSLKEIYSLNNLVLDTIISLTAKSLGAVVDPTVDEPNSIILEHATLRFLDSVTNFYVEFNVKPAVSQTGMVRYKTRCEIVFNGLNRHEFSVSTNGYPWKKDARSFETINFHGHVFEEACWYFQNKLIVNEFGFPLYLYINNLDELRSFLVTYTML